MSSNNLGRFDTWMKNTYTLISMIKELQSSCTIQHIRSFSSPQFCFDYNTGFNYQTVFKFNIPSEIEMPPPNTYIVPPTSAIGTSVWTNPHAVPQAMLGSQTSPKSIDQVIITCDSHYKILHIKWVRRLTGNLYSISSSDSNTFEYMDGGLVRNTFLFLPHNKLMIDGIIYSNESPDAFNNDISTDGTEPKVRFLDMLQFREVFADGLFE